MLGFDTIGNATVIAYDGKPILATDPWIVGSAYFGSWGPSHEIPKEQMDAILACPYVWFSHGHPDHINHDSLVRLADKTILLADHVGGRIAREFREQGLKVEILKDREWRELSPHVKVLSIADYNQDSLLLIDINGRLLVDMNDGYALGSERFVKNIVKQYKRSFMLRLFSYGDADMINYWSEDGTRLPSAASSKKPVGPIAQAFSELYGVTHIIPFSCFHRYQRSDSAWVNEYTTPAEAFEVGFNSKSVTLLPAFIRYDCVSDTWTEIKPKSLFGTIHDPKEFGDDWSDLLTTEDKKALKEYFGKMEILKGHLDAVIFNVGGQDYAVDIAAPTDERTNRSVTFAVPRHSLMEAVRYRVFDDLLIGNFMKTTLHGNWGDSRLYPHFAPIVPKYSDNGEANSKAQLKAYFDTYKARSPLDFMLHRLEAQTVQKVRSMLDPSSPLFYAGKKTYLQLRKLIG